jgi:hypothetical protein
MDEAHGVLRAGNWTIPLLFTRLPADFEYQISATMSDVHRLCGFCHNAGITDATGRSTLGSGEDGLLPDLLGQAGAHA